MLNSEKKRKKNTGDVLTFTLRLIDDKNNNIELNSREKEFPIIQLLIGFLAWTNLIKENKKQEKSPLRTFLLNLRKICQIFHVKLLKLAKQ